MAALEEGTMAVQLVAARGVKAAELAVVVWGAAAAWEEAHLAAA